MFIFLINYTKQSFFATFSFILLITRTFILLITPTCSLILLITRSNRFLQEQNDLFLRFFRIHSLYLLCSLPSPSQHACPRRRRIHACPRRRRIHAFCGSPAPSQQARRGACGLQLPPPLGPPRPALRQQLYFGQHRRGRGPLRL